MFIIIKELYVCTNQNGDNARQTFNFIIMKTKTIDVNAKEWFDNKNGNSYFCGTITLNFGNKTRFPLTVFGCFALGQKTQLAVIKNVDAATEKQRGHKARGFPPW